MFGNAIQRRAIRGRTMQRRRNGSHPIQHFWDRRFPSLLAPVYLPALPQFLSAYFEKFQKVFPVIHQPTFIAATAQQPLLQAVACVGAVYTSGEDYCDISRALLESGLKSLDIYVNNHPRVGIQETWVLQAYLLFEYFAIYSCEDSLFNTALEIHRKLVDVARQYQLLQDGVMSGTAGQGLSSPADSTAAHGSSLGRDWHLAIRSESRKRVMYSLYYLDSQLSMCFNLRPHLAALEVKFDLPCRDDVWSAPTAEAWKMLAIDQDGSFNEEDDDDANGEPRPPHGDLYSSLMHLMNPRPQAPPLGLLWHSSFASLMLIVQLQMMVRDLTLGSTFLYRNIRADDPNHALSIISESDRAQVMQALEALADLMPRVCSQKAIGDPQSPDNSLWNHVWVAWHYTALCLTHQDGLLTSGIVEYSLPTAISTAWELGRPRAKKYRDVYEDRDVVRVATHLARILDLLTRPALGASVGPECTGSEDPFTTVIAFKSCLMGWRIVRLITIGIQDSLRGQRSTILPSVYTAFGRSMMYDILTALDPENDGRLEDVTGDERLSESSPRSSEMLKDSERHYLERIEDALTRRNHWPLATWIAAVFTETFHGED
ncbi:early growth response protein 1 (egr-1) [Geosmithia morbida]|uniref:Early growth response protein 1 (Egr-1) n=1 Tax=Geosmithia morbida TaxID=1094350 RepID=A0A9P5D430_9HYPO|nr:early growth response protein 1 (egr-1) [Geosmithia morbida]KAF4123091.1 early growth response protein 1 (egr-1) [Geosmithia morbida]